MTLGLIYRRRGRLPESEQAYRRALEFEPNNATAYSGLGRAYEEQGQLDQAEQSYKKAIELRPDYWGNHNELAYFYHLEGRHEEACRLRPSSFWATSMSCATFSSAARASSSCGSAAIAWASVKGFAGLLGTSLQIRSTRP